MDRPPPARSTGTSHLHAIDVVRVTTVAMVISVHAISVLLPPGDGAAGAVLAVFHSSREVFLVLSGLVLTWAAADRPVRPGALWRRRVPLVAVPYIAWTTVYWASAGAPGGIVHYGLDLLDGGAHFHLYFLLLTLQLYLVMPWLLPWLRARATRPWWILGASALVQLAFTAVVHWDLPVPPPLSWLASHPGTWLPSYQLYVVVGIVVGMHAEAVTEWCSRRVATLSWAALAAAGTALAAYAAGVAAGASPDRASAVFQPTVVVEAIAFGALELGLGQRLVDRAGQATLRRLAICSDISFGIYLAHPLLLQAVDEWTDIPGLLARMSPADATAAVVVVIVPAVGLLTGLAVHAVRTTPLSLLVTGRCRRPASATTTAGPPVLAAPASMLAPLMAPLPVDPAAGAPA